MQQGLNPGAMLLPTPLYQKGGPAAVHKGDRTAEDDYVVRVGASWQRNDNRSIHMSLLSWP